MLSRVSPHHLLPKQSLFIKLRLGKKEETFIVSFDFFLLLKYKSRVQKKPSRQWLEFSKFLLVHRRKIYNNMFSRKKYSVNNKYKIFAYRVNRSYKAKKFRGKFPF